MSKFKKLTSKMPNKEADKKHAQGFKQRQEERAKQHAQQERLQTVDSIWYDNNYTK